MSIDIISTVLKNCDELCHKTAIKFENTDINYHDLKIGIFKYMYLLQENDFEEEDDLAIYGYKSPELIYTIFACLALNIRFVLLNDKITKSLKDKVDSLPFKTLNLKDMAQRKVEAKNIDTFDIKWECDHRKSHYCLTSGSTGTSKLATNSRWGLANVISYGLTTLEINQQTIYYQNASILFDIFLWESLTPLVAGGTLVIESNENAWNLHKAVELVYKHQVTHLQLTPSLITYFADLIDSSKTDLKYLLSIGEVMTLNLAQKVLKKLPNTNLINHYGPCECAVYIMSHLVNENDLDMPGIPLGTPIPNIKLIYQQTDEDNVFEILVKNPELNNGYYLHPPESADHYSTGDLVRRHNDIFYFIGRNDFQTKINGLRINLLEIEEILSSIFMQLVVCIKINETTLVAFHENDFIFCEELKEKLNNQLINSIQPKKIIKIDSFPRLQTGKVDRNQLGSDYVNQY